jgi:hypothetical protein
MSKAMNDQHRRRLAGETPMVSLMNAQPATVCC